MADSKSETDLVFCGETLLFAHIICFYSHGGDFTIEGDNYWMTLQPERYVYLDNGIVFTVRSHHDFH
jgi:hypothetical protein